MAKVITVGQQKGGAGKTTVAAHLAVSLAQAGNKVAIIDIDPQGSLTCWHELREKKFGKNYTGMHFSASPGWRIESTVSSLLDKCDYVIIDAPPHTETETKSAIRSSDLVIVPMQPSPADLWATTNVLEFANSENKKAIILLNRYNASSKIAKQIIKQIKYPYFKSTLGNRVAFSSCFLNGVCVTENMPESIAASEVRDFTEELTGLFVNPRKNKQKKEKEKEKELS